MNKIWIAVIGVIALIGVALISGYNSLVGLDEGVTGKWAQVETQLQRRNDLIPNLVNTVKGYAGHEEKVFKDVSDARAKLGGAKSMQDVSQADAELSDALSRLLVVVENYPALKADANFRALQDELAGTENRIAVARKDYNDNVQVFNAKIRSLPTSIYTSLFGFDKRDYFKSEESAKTAPKVAF